MGFEYDTAYGVVGDNVTDDTVNLQTAINTATANGNGLYITGRSAISIQGSSVPILTIPSNANIKFMRGASLRLIGPYSTYSYSMMALWSVTNVTIDYPMLDGSQELQTLPPIQQDFGMGIDIRGGSGHTINHADIRDTWGDGIYIAGDNTTGAAPSSILITQPHILGAHRNNITVICANGLIIERPILENPLTNTPGCGIDFEPDSNADMLQNIEVINPICMNGNIGIAIDISSLPGPVAQTVSIKISGTDQIGATYMGIAFGTFTKGGHSISGSVVVNYPRYYHCAGTSLIPTGWNQTAVPITISNPTTIA